MNWCFDLPAALYMVNSETDLQQKQLQFSETPDFLIIQSLDLPINGAISSDV